jgi:predicted dehydrogenase
MPRNYRVAVIGRTGQGNYGHGLDIVWRSVSNVQIVAVADADERGRAAAQQRLGARNAYADYREMLRRERPEIVSVATRWLDAHRDMVVACAEAGASIFLEKPMCRTLAEADEMIAACERHHVKLAIAHQTRYSPRLERVRELIASDRFGQILEIRCRGKEDSRGGGEDMMVLGTHLMDLMRFVAGDARWCFGRVGVTTNQNVRSIVRADVREGNEGIGPLAGDHITAMYGFDRGMVGHFSTHRANRRPTDADRFGMTVLGSRGIIQLTTGALPPAYFLPDPGWFPGRSRAQWQEITSAGLGQPETLRETSLPAANVWIVRDLMEAIERDRQPKGNMYDGRAALEMILAVYESHRLHTTVELPLRNRRHPLSLL